MKSETLLSARSFDLSPSGDIQRMTIDDLIDGVCKKKLEILKSYGDDFDNAKLSERVKEWQAKLEGSLTAGWSDEAQRLFYGKRILAGLQSWMFGTRTILLWEHIANSKDPRCIAAVKPLKEILERV